jgi:hypothetical protein
MEIKPGLYTHFKGGRYKVIGRAYNSETLELMVVYMSLYHRPDREDHPTWVRPVTMFFGEVQKLEYVGPRFKFVDATGPFTCSDCSAEL